jgi:hypothetical protein
MALLTPQQLREATERDYARAAAAAGQVVSKESIRKLAMADLLLVEAARREGDLRENTRSRIVKPGQRDMVAGKGPAPRGEMGERGEVLRTRLLHANPWLTDERWARAVQRLKRIIAGSIGKTFASAAQNAEVPKLAKEWVEIYAYFLTRHRPPVFGQNVVNPFWGLSDEDADRMVRAAVEDICDRSTGSLGAWRTPK